MEIIHYVLIYLSISTIIFCSLLFSQRKKFLKMEKPFYLILKNVLFSLFFGVLLPFIILNPEVLSGLTHVPLSTGGESEENAYTKSTEYEKDWSIIAGILMLILIPILLLAFFAG